MQQFLMIFFAILATLFALGVILAKHPMRSALSLIGTMVSLAAIYALLGVFVVAVFQILIYVGAVMVFMIYVIMLLDNKDDLLDFRFSKYLPHSFAILLGFAIVLFFAVCKSKIFQEPEVQNEQLFSFVTFSKEFMTSYLLHFELASVFLLVAIIASLIALKFERKELK